MENFLNTYLEQAHKEISENSVNGFVNAIKKLFDNMSCNCFLANEDKEIYKKQLLLIEEFTDDNTNYELNLAKGYLYSRNKNEIKAYHYLSIAIEANKSEDLAFALRSYIDSEINSENIDDAQNAVRLNPTARNYFVLANLCDKKDVIESEKSIIYFNESIRLNPDFPCAFNNRATRFQKIGNYSQAIDDYKKCLTLDPNHWAYYSLLGCLENQKLYEEIPFYAKKGLEKHPDDLRYHNILGRIHSRLEQWELSIIHFEEFLKKYPENQNSKRRLDVAKKAILEEKISEAKGAFTNDCFEKCLSLFNEYIAYGGVFIEKDLDIYLLGIIKNKDKSIKIDKNNSSYIKLNNLKQSCLDKIQEKNELTEEEKNVDKLMKYGSNHTLGFGNYKGEKIKEILTKDAHYILWCIIKLEHFSIENSIFTNPVFKQEPLLSQAVESNLIKELIIKEWKPEEESWDDDFYYDSYDDDTYSFNSDYYNDSLDMDQQSPEFWDSL